MNLTRHRYEVDGWGVGEVWVRGGVLVLHEQPTPLGTAPNGRAPACPALPPGADRDLEPLDAGGPLGGARPPEVTLSGEGARKGDDFVTELCRRFGGHLAGRPTDYRDVAIDLAWFSAFHVELAHALREVAWGEVVTYGELAALAGRPGAARAAGSFCARNPYALVVPCHRVLAAGGIGGYGPSGVALKRRLLALEGVCR